MTARMSACRLAESTVMAALWTRNPAQGACRNRGLLQGRVPHPGIHWVAIDAGQQIATIERAQFWHLSATSPMPAVTALSDPLVALLDPRRRAVALWRERAREAQRIDPSLAAPFAALEVSERQHAEQLARELSLMRQEALRRVAGRLGQLRSGGSPRGGGLQAAIAALELAIDQESSLQDALAELAAQTSDAELRLRAMALALAGARHLKVLRETAGRLRCKL
jgi:hypothetical protein